MDYEQAFSPDSFHPQHRGADTRVCGVETRLDALVEVYSDLGAPGIETSLDAAA
jgi:hypothetical protein